jgi:hypothetical protein
MPNLWRAVHDVSGAMAVLGPAMSRRTRDSDASDESIHPGVRVHEAMVDAKGLRPVPPARRVRPRRAHGNAADALAVEDRRLPGGK